MLTHVATQTEERVQDGIRHGDVKIDWKCGNSCVMKAQKGRVFSFAATWGPKCNGFTGKRTLEFCGACRQSRRGSRQQIKSWCIFLLLLSISPFCNCNLYFYQYRACHVGPIFS